jgi:disulfide bond formation protein DsbB
MSRVARLLSFSLIVILAFYGIGFVLYHAFTPVSIMLGQESARYNVGDSCALILEYPAEVPIEVSYQKNGGITAQPRNPLDAELAPFEQSIRLRVEWYG